MAFKRRPVCLLHHIRDDTSVLPRLYSRQDQPKGASMKIYLMMLMVGALFTAIRFTTVQDKNSTSLPQ